MHVYFEFGHVVQPYFLLCCVVDGYIQVLSDYCHCLCSGVYGSHVLDCVELFARAAESIFAIIVMSS